MNEQSRAIERRDLAVVAIVAGFAFVALVGGIDRSPLYPILPAGSSPLSPFRTAARVAGLDALAPVWKAGVAIAAVIGAVGAFLFALREAWRGNVPVRVVTWLGIAFVAVAVCMPLLLSRDVYSYSMYGRISSLHHANPYVSTPRDFRSDPMFPLVGPQWRGTTAVYGPAFTLLSRVLTSWIRGPIALIWAYKAIAGAAAIASILLVARVARRVWPARASFATALFAWNPVVVFHGVGGGHNDLLVGLSVIGALSILLRGGAHRAGADASSDGASLRGVRRELAATAVLTLGTLVKATAAIPLVLVVTACVWRRPPSDRRRALGAHVAVAAALGVLFALPFFQLHDPTLGLATLATHEGWLGPSRFFRVVLGHLGSAIGGEPGRTALEVLVRVAFPVVFVMAFAGIVRWVARSVSATSEWSRETFAAEQGAAWAWALLLATLTSPVLLPWYVVWTVPVAWLLPRTARRSMVALCAIVALSQTVAAAVNYPTIFHGTLFVGHYFLTPILFVILVVLLRDLRSRLRDGRGLGARLPAASADAPRHDVPAAADQR